ncbi:molybdate ABC transporter substrate-binding protein [Heyndrickxia acidiproducens]|uniref:molybdate ABC transporter substrate-binding protein n=1 Tax=Heyndrickxia acidiproducens TaxID=1121084 RepID=UPI00037D6960|nr:molybdate ABC transporter substrate-binding protein [Heyndrickxia acidiproducens]
MKKLSFILLCVVLLTACSTQKKTASSPEEINVAAASDLTKSFQKIGKQFEKQTGIKVKFIFGASGELEAQIENGAPYDVYAAANHTYVKKLKDKNLITANSDKVYALGEIGVATRKDSKIQPADPDGLTSRQVKKIAIANPKTAPYGMAAKQALQKAGIWDKVKDKLVYAKNISDTLTYVQSGNAEAGLVSHSLVQGEPVRYRMIDDSLYDPLQQTMAVVKNSKQQKAAQKFCAFLTGPQGKRILKQYGYAIPEGK